ncbi:MAG: alpha/beta hydrolase family protein [Ginsengibacter sp.]
MKIYRIFFSIILGIILFFSFQRSFAASADTVSIYSSAMKKSIKCVVILPYSYNNQVNKFPVVYLLHGYSGNFSNWIQKVPEIKNYADQFQLIIVCPDGDFSSWYIDSPADSTMKYDTYISKEVPHYIDSSYRTLNDRKYRAIAGLSMGGHGALFLSWRNETIFGAVGSMSGAVDLVSTKTKYNIPTVFGDSSQIGNIYKYSVVNIVRNKIDYVPALIFSCGIDDPFIVSNRKLNSELLEMKIPHTYVEKEGKHNWDFWSNDIGFQLLFFHQFFQKKY